MLISIILVGKGIIGGKVLIISTYCYKCNGFRVGQLCSVLTQELLGCSDSDSDPVGLGRNLLLETCFSWIG